MWSELVTLNDSEGTVPLSPVFAAFVPLVFIDNINILSYSVDLKLLNKF